MQTAQDKQAMYDLLEKQAESLGEGVTSPLPILANAAALLWQTLPEINWAGFYLLKGDELLLGPFQGKIACTRIALGRGVCGTAAATREIQVVPDVHRFPGHIACDSASASEIVLPLEDGEGRLLGVLDIDSPMPGRFDSEDAAGLSRLCGVMLRGMDWRNGLI